MKSPLVSIVIPVYNEERFISAALESILNQSFSQWECIIIDDASNDKTQEIIKQYLQKDDRFRSFRNDQNLGVWACRNRWIAASTWRYIAFQDADDISYPDRIQTLVHHMESHPEISICWSAVTLIFEDGSTKQRTYPTLDSDIRKALFRYTPISQSSAIVRTKALKKMDGFNWSLRLAEDLDFLFRLGEEGLFSNLHQPLLEYRVRKNSTTTKNLTEMGKLTFLIREKYREHYRPDFWSIIIDRMERVIFYCTPRRFLVWVFLFTRNHKIVQRLFLR